VYTEQLTQALALADQIPPQSVNNANTASTGIDMSKCRRALFDVQIGTYTGAATVQAVLQTCSLANFASGVHNMTGGITSAFNNANNNTHLTLETTDEAVAQQNPGDRYVRVTIIVGVNAVVVGATGWAGEAPHKPSSLVSGLGSNVVLSQLVVT
jgi:hypothetical protein